MFRSPSPAGLPHITTMLDDLHATPAQIAKHLGLKESTLKTYRRQGGAPMAVLLALFWETKWGISTIEITAGNQAAHYYRDAMLSKRELERMSGIIWHLEQELSRDSGTRPANLPIFNVG